MTPHETEIRAAIAKHAGEVIPHIEACEPQHAAILPSEMLAFCCLALARGCQSAVESGRRYGYSTDVLSRIFETVSFEIDPLPEYDARFAKRGNLLMLRTDGAALPTFHRKEPAALLLDGPKGLPALRLATLIAERYRLIAIHDAHPGSQLRDAVEDTAYLTDNAWLIENFGHLDGPSLDLRGYASHAELLSVGNVLAILGAP